MSMIGQVRIGGHKEIIAIGSYADHGDNRAEVAFVVREDFQSMGIASYLLATLQRVAGGNGFTGFLGTVLRENIAMLQVFKKRYPHAQTKLSGGLDVEIFMDFDDAADFGRQG